MRNIGAGISGNLIAPLFAAALGLSSILPFSYGQPFFLFIATVFAVIFSTYIFRNEWLASFLQGAMLFYCFATISAVSGVIQINYLYYIIMFFCWFVVTVIFALILFIHRSLRGSNSSGLERGPSKVTNVTIINNTRVSKRPKRNNSEYKRD